MKTFNATDAKNRFGELLDSAQAGPVAIQKNGRDVAVVLSVEEYEKYINRDDGVDPALQASLKRSTKRWSKVYDALAK